MRRWAGKEIGRNQIKAMAKRKGGGVLEVELVRVW